MNAKKQDLWEKCEGLLDTCRDYVHHPEEYVRPFEVRINGKLRHLVTYKADEKGWKLRVFHTTFAELIQGYYRQARSSYAYAKRKNILNCVERHLKNSIFLKTDIHAYFDSISCDNIQERMEDLKVSLAKRDDFNLMTQACFYEDKLPLGFTSSPVLSDFFLAQLDQKYQKSKEVVYTRYADDFLISASGQDAIEKLLSFKAELQADLLIRDLQLNKKKTYIRELKQPGDALHVLGVNIVKTPYKKNRITISDSYLRETSKAICAWLDKVPSEESNHDAEVIWGRVNFIKMCSEKSYEKLLKMVTVKSGRDGEEIAEKIRETVKKVTTERTA